MSSLPPPPPTTGPRPAASIGAGRPRPARLTRRAAPPASIAALALVAGALRGTAAPAAAAATLEGTPWLAVSCVDPAGWFRPVPPGVEITATFQAGQVAGLAGCNQYSAGYQLAQDVAGIVRIGPAAATQRFCADPPGVMEQEGAYLRALERVARFHLVGERLVLQAADWSPLALYVPRPAELPGGHRVGGPQLQQRARRSCLDPRRERDHRPLRRGAPVRVGRLQPVQRRLHPGAGRRRPQHHPGGLHPHLLRRAGGGDGPGGGVPGGPRRRPPVTASRATS